MNRYSILLILTQLSLLLSLTPSEAQKATSVLYMTNDDTVNIAFIWDSTNHIAQLEIENLKSQPIQFDTLFQPSMVTCSNFRDTLHAVYLGNTELERNDFHEDLSKYFYTLPPGEKLIIFRTGWEDISTPYLILGFLYGTDPYHKQTVFLANMDYHNCRP